MKYLQNTAKLILILFVIGSCKQKIIEENVGSYSNGNPIKKEYYLQKGNSKELVREIQYYNDGTIKQKGNFKNGVKNGKWTHYYQNGYIWSEGYFDNGLREGMSIVYFNNGNKQYEGSYSSGKPDGKWSFYNENGEKLKVVLYKNGKIISTENLTVPYK